VTAVVVGEEYTLNIVDPSLLDIIIDNNAERLIVYLIIISKDTGE